ncbi:MAG TPA: glycosyltransferase family 39 protein, partial [Thermoanaerobaculia bacterium]|nr:glycosyltransferase family 39 protein [Thermoanaerobaculia bacterium]
GERSDILLWMRVPMLVLFAVVIAATYLLGRRLYDARIGLWAAALLALFPPFFLKSLEFRTDNLWNACWMLALVVLTGGALDGRRMFVAGLLLGAALATSLKTSLLFITLGGAALLVRLFVRREKWPPLHWLLAGAAILPAAFMIFFASRGAWDALVYCTITFNGALAKTRDHLWIGRAIFPFAAAALVFTAWRFRMTAHPWRWFFAVAIAVFTIVLAGFWLLISPRDFLPLMPLFAIFGAALAMRARNAVATLATIAVLSIAALWYYADRFENNTDWHVTMMDQALRLTRPGELLMDVKGETIYRRRPFYHAFENITRAQMAHGLIGDTVAEEVVRKRAYVAQADGPMWPPRARAFLSANFLNMGRLRAAGQWIREDGTFTIAIPGEYAIVTPMGEARGTLDGVPYTGARMLGAGAHRFEGEKGAAVMWAPAFRRGHSPFHLRDLEF